MNYITLAGIWTGRRPLLAALAIGLVMQSPGAFAQACDADGDGVDSTRCGGADCDDTDPNRFPGNAEVCDASDADEDCNPSTFGNRDTDGDGFVDASCCNDAGAGAPICGRDCNDTAPTIHPLASDFCNGVDENCDGVVDDATQSPALNARFFDADRDGYGRPGAGALACIGDPGFAAIGGDCNDANPAIVPGAVICSQDSVSAFVCRSDGTLMATACGEGAVCVSQPNGLGICESEKPKKLN